MGLPLYVTITVTVNRRTQRILQYRRLPQLFTRILVLVSALLNERHHCHEETEIVNSPSPACYGEREYISGLRALPCMFRGGVLGSMLCALRPRFSALGSGLHLFESVCYVASAKPVSA